MRVVSLNVNGIRSAEKKGLSRWLKGVGWGVGIGDMRVDFGYRLDDVPRSLQILLRFSRTF